MCNLCNLSIRLEELIFEKKSNPNKIATAIGVSTITIYRYLNNSRTPTLENTIALANYFDCTIDYLVGREN